MHPYRRLCPQMFNFGSRRDSESTWSLAATVKANSLLGSRRYGCNPATLKLRLEKASDSELLVQQRP